jgi:hypothetical protein
VKLDCHEIEELTGAYLADQLTVQERFRVEMHLNACELCATELAELQAVIGSLTEEFESEEREPVLDDARREALRSAWIESAPPSRAILSKWRTVRRVAMTLATAASILLGSYLGLVSGQNRVQTDDTVFEVSTLPIAIPVVYDDPITDPAYGVSFTGTPYPFALPIMNAGLPEYGTGSTVFARQASVSRTRAPYIGLPVPRPNYDFDEASLGTE